MKIIWVSHSEWMTGGAELVLQEAVSGLLTVGHEVHVIFPGQGELNQKFAEMGASVWIVPHYANWAYTGFTPNLHYRARRLFDNLRRARRLAKLFRQLQPDVVISNTIGSPGGALAAKWAGIPHVWYVHELFGKDCHDQVFFDFGTTLSLKLMNWLSRLIVVNSVAVQEKFGSGIPVEKLRLIYYGVEVPPQSAPVQRTDDFFKLIIVGRLSPGKRQEDAIRATSLLAHKGLPIQLSVVGNQQTDYATFLRTLVRDLRVEQQVSFVDYTPDPHTLVAEADVALMCSRGEPFGRVTVEAMKLGKPVIGAAGAGTSELIQDGVNGLTYRFGDTDGLCRCVESLYRNPNLLQQMGIAAKQWANEQFTPAVYVANLVQVLEEASLNQWRWANQLKFRD